MLLRFDVKLAFTILFHGLIAHASLLEGLLPRQAFPPACSELSFAAAYCNSASPGFSNLPSSAKAPCLCYSSTVFSPNEFDNAVDRCVEYLATADPEEYSVALPLVGFCTIVGDVLATPVAGPTFITSVSPNPVQTPTAPANLSPTPIALPATTDTLVSGGAGTITAPPIVPTILPEACTIIENVLSTCNIYSPGFRTFASTDQAPCLCYNSTSYIPDLWDNLLETCYSYISTADPTEYSSAGLQSLLGFCTNVGDIRNSALAPMPGRFSQGVVSSGLSTMSLGPITSASGAGGISVSTVLVTQPPPTTVTAGAASFGPRLKMALVPLLISAMLLSI